MRNKDNPDRKNSWIGKPYQILDNSAAAVAWDQEFGNVAYLELNANITLSKIDGLKNGEEYTLIVQQDATGSRTLTYASEYKFAGGSAPIPTAAASSVDVIKFIGGLNGSILATSVVQNLS